MQKSLKDNLTFEMFKKIIIFNKSDEIVLLGDEINTILLNDGIDIKKTVLNNFSDTEGKKLSEQIHTLRKKKLFSLNFAFSKSKTEFIILPAVTENFDEIIFSVKKEIEQINNIKNELKGSEKELECLYNISRELDRDISFEKLLENSIPCIKNGMRYSEILNVVIELDGKIIGTKIKNEGNKYYELKENILKNKKIRGSIIVTYLEKRIFNNEEGALTREIARKISRALENKEKKRDLEKRKQILTEKNKTLLKLTTECRESREKLQTFFKAIEDIIIVIDKNFNIIMSNDNEIGNSGKCYKKLFNSDTICENCPALITFKTTKTGNLERTSGEKTLLLNSYPIYGKSNKVNQVLELCRDITAYKKMESNLLQSRRLASLGKLVAGVAHEINNPNTFILGNIKIVREAFNDILPITDDYYKKDNHLKIARLDYNIFKEHILILLEDMENGSIRLKKIVEDLRNFAKKDNNILTEDVDINNVLENTVRFIEKQISNNIIIEKNLYPNLPHIIGNISKLEQVFVNMLLNASHAIDKKNGLIIIKTEFEKITDSILITIQDNGNGIEKENQKHIFDPFFTTKRNKGGTGLGLSISYRIIEEHKGIIKVNSVVGEGATFQICIPVNKK